MTYQDLEMLMIQCFNLFISLCLQRDSSRVLLGATDGAMLCIIVLVLLMAPLWLYDYLCILLTWLTCNLYAQVILIRLVVFDIFTLLFCDCSIFIGKDFCDTGSWNLF